MSDANVTPRLRFTVTENGIAIGAPGLDAFKVWLQTNPDKTIDDYNDFLQKPATDAATAFAIVADLWAHAESARVSAESLRAAAAQSQATAEGLRVLAEQARDQVEQLRASAESTRGSNEQARVEAEQARVAAEGLRIQAEEARVTAEGLRIQAEEARVTAEGLRVIAEAARVSAEQGRVTAEGLRVTAESARATAEGLRVTAENSRAAAEALRVTAETTRQTNEGTRQTQESTRQSQESTRQSYYNAQGKKYLGDKSADPTLDNEGAALVAGALYFNTTSQMIRRWSGSAWANNFNPTVQQVAGSSTSDVISQKGASGLLQEASINCFSRYSAGDLQQIASGSTTKAIIYNAFKSLQLFGFNSLLPHRILMFWANAYGPGNSYYRISIQALSGGTWSGVYDSGSKAALTGAITINASGITTFDFTNSNKRVIAQIDYTLIPSAYLQLDTFGVSDPIMIIGQQCFVMSNALDVSHASVNALTLSTKNEILFPCFVRYLADLSLLNAEYVAGYQRKLKYQSFKSLKLYGFDRTKIYKLRVLWVDSYNPGNHYYRIIISQYSGSGTTWTDYFDTGVTEKSTLGVVDGKCFVWDQTVSTLRMVAVIDFANLQVNDSSTLSDNASDPPVIISPACLESQSLSPTSNVEFNSLRLAGVAVNPGTILNYSANKLRFNSRRKPTFAFIWDDLNDTDALVYSVFREYNMLPSFALMGSRFTGTTVIARYQGYYMNGCSILAHSMTHPAMSNSGTISAATVEYEMAESKKLIEAQGIKVSGWVTPSSSLHADFLPQMIKNFGYGFTDLNAGVFNQTVDPVKMARYGIESSMANHDHTTILTRIDNAIANSELLVFYGHQLPSTYLNADTTPYITEADLRIVLAYLKTKVDANLCQVMSMDEAVASYYKTPLY